MMFLKLVFKNIWHKKLNSFLSIILMSVGIFLISFVGFVATQLENNLTKNTKGVDMVVGAKGSPLQLILSGLFQLDSPTGNVKFQELMSLKSNPLIKTIIPVSMGDNYGGFRIVGSDNSYVEHFGGSIVEGRRISKDHEVMIGTDVKNLKVGDSFQSAHGLDKDGEKHEEEPMKVVGRISKTNTVLDKLIVCDLESIWHMHHAESQADSLKEVTCGLIKFRSPLGLMTIPRNVNSNTNMMAALPSIEVNRLFSLFGTGIKVLSYLAWAIMLVSGLSVFVNLYNSLKERKYEMALMLSMGARKWQLFMLLLLEAFILVLFSFFIGLILSRLASVLVLNWADFPSIKVWFISGQEIYLLVASLLVGIFAAVLPSFNIYKLNISKTLAQE